jgi:hypothetical protein
MTITSLQNRAYALCLQSGRYEIMVDLPTMDCLQLNGLITFLLRSNGF